jgi:SAM-dependent methyltransferase
LAELRALLAKNLEEGFRATANGQLVISYETSVTPHLRKNLACRVAVTGPADTSKYEHWRQASHGQALFGSHPDARVLSLVAELGPAQSVPILDIGAGIGRNALPLARLGHAVEAIEVTPRFAQELRDTAQRENLPVSVIPQDFFDPCAPLSLGLYRAIILSEVVSDFRGTRQLRLLFERAASCLLPGGKLLFNIFLAAPAYRPDALARQMAEVAWSCLFTRDELHTALSGLPLTIVSDVAVVEYEKSHLPPDAWPPTPWFKSWASGQSIFPLGSDRSPMEMRWIAAERQEIGRV